MNKYLKQLVELSKLDKQIDSYIPRLESIDEHLLSSQAKIDEIDEQVSLTNNEIEEITAQISSTNIHIGEFSTKLKDIAKKSSTIKTERELKSLNLEEELVKDQLQAANEEIARLEKLNSTKEDNKNELIAQKDEAIANLEKTKLDTDEEKKNIEEQRNQFYAQKEELLKNMNQKVITFYEKIRKWAKNTAVVPVKKQACYGCFIKINDKTYSNVLNGEDIITCPHCGRILYCEEADKAKE